MIDKDNKIFEIAFAAAMLIICLSCGSSESAPGNTVMFDDFGVDGNLYKPVSDATGAGGGNAVVLLSSKYTEEFDSCTLTLADGTAHNLICLKAAFTQTPFSCFSNGNRQTWRAGVRCEEVADQPIVQCELGDTSFVFSSTGSRCERR